MFRVCDNCGYGVTDSRLLSLLECFDVTCPTCGQKIKRNIGVVDVEQPETEEEVTEITWEILDSMPDVELLVGCGDEKE